MRWLIDFIAGIAASLAGRSWRWPAVVKIVLKRDGDKCRNCGRHKSQVRIVGHHVVPYHVMPRLELVEGNILSLCDPLLDRKAGCHLRVGHTDKQGRCGWQYWNPNAIEDAAVNLVKATEAKT